MARYQAGGSAGLYDRSSRPHRSPRRLASGLAERVIELRRQHMPGYEIARRTGASPASVSRLLRSARLSRWRDLNPPPPIQRYEHPVPGDLLHLDIKGMTRFSDVTLRGDGRLRGKRQHPGFLALHMAIDDHSRMAFTQMLPDQKAASTIAFLHSDLLLSPIQPEPLKQTSSLNRISPRVENTGARMPSVHTATLEIAYDDSGPADGSPLLLLHGWPDAPCTWHAVAAKLNAAGYRTVAPSLRGFGDTKFFHAGTPRVAQPPVLAQDAIDLADALGLERFAVIGHDWGARIAYTLAALFPERLSSITAMSVAWQPRGEAKAPGFDQARRYWYQWFMCTDGGVEQVHADPVGFARIQWETWSPSGWFTEQEFAETAKSFTNPDWVAITLNSYRSRWRPDEPKAEQTDPSYDALQAKLKSVEKLATPTLLIHGAADTCLAAEETEDQAKYFSSRHDRVVIKGAGHFVQREAPDAVAAAVLRHLAAHP